MGHHELEWHSPQIMNLKRHFIYQLTMRYPLYNGQKIIVFTLQMYFTCHFTLDNHNLAWDFHMSNQSFIEGILATSSFVNNQLQYEIHTGLRSQCLEISTQNNESKITKHFLNASTIFSILHPLNIMIIKDLKISIMTTLYCSLLYFLH